MVTASFRCADRARAGPPRDGDATSRRNRCYLILDTEDLDSAESRHAVAPLAQVGMLDFAYIELAPPA